MREESDKNILDPETANTLISRILERLELVYGGITCDDTTSQQHRTFDGSCNNQRRPEWGMVNLPLRRYTLSAYSDGKKAPRKSTTGQELPSARAISRQVTEDSDDLIANGYAALMVHFGQLLIHDTDQVPVESDTCTGCQTSHICLPIPITEGDPVFPNQDCIEFVRSVAAPALHGYQPWAYDQPNIITAYLDASFIYGSSLAKVNSLRITGDPQGLMRVTPNPIPGGKGLLPPDNNLRSCAGRNGKVSCGLAGDNRAAEQVGLTALHTVWLREHNRIARELSGVNPHWDGDRVFDETRKIVGAEWQHIVYNEYLPLLIGQRYMRRYRLDVNRVDLAEYLYRTRVDATVRNGFATAVFRLGHSQIPTTIWRVDKEFQRVFSDIKTREAFFNATHVYNVEEGGVGSILRGMLVQPLLVIDGAFSPALTDHLFEDPEKGFGLDLVSLNIQRGRDHGLPGYTVFREDVCGLSQVRSWQELTAVVGDKTAQRLRTIYSTVRDIDPFVGFFSEPPMPGALIGPTLACLIGKQFRSLKYGDRFWYENKSGQQALTDAQQDEIRKSNLARVLCDNIDDLPEIQPFPFLQADEDSSRCQSLNPYTTFVEYSKYYRYPNRTGCLLNDFSNQRVSCRDLSAIPRMNLGVWAEHYY
ncbi:lactoperoxidase-like [Asterias rubens]|uniref:lactoperoxidase-like n=1 Tax=Asterias rubens TaxID=7604 RepID=UPI001454FF49|nr:lactoperoxidase-like [Asterias rubens]